jgi:hypothetical protein
LTTDVSLQTIKSTLEDFHDIIHALRQTMEISILGQTKCFISLGISIAAMALVSFNAYRITQIDAEIANLKTKRDFLIDVTHLHEAHLIHLDQKIE